MEFPSQPTASLALVEKVGSSQVEARDKPDSVVADQEKLDREGADQVARREGADQVVAARGLASSKTKKAPLEDQAGLFDLIVKQKLVDYQLYSSPT